MTLGDAIATICALVLLYVIWRGAVAVDRRDRKREEERGQ